jgi:hypothetical protein
MRITSQNQVPLSSVNSGAASAARGDGTPAPAPSIVPMPAQPVLDSPAPAYNLVPSFELQTLDALLHEIPPVREDVINATVQKLASGQLRTPDVAARTAAAILGM